MDVCESARALHKQAVLDKARIPLILSEKNNALNAVSPRGPRTREVTSRYKLPTPSTPSISRRSPSPTLTRTSADNVHFMSKRALSAERKRPSTPLSPTTPTTPVNESSVGTQLHSRRLNNGGRLPEGLWPSTMRSLSVSFQSDSISIPVSKKEKPVPNVSFDRTLRPSSNVAHKQDDMPPSLSRKPTPERKRSPLKGKSAPDQSENSKPVDVMHSRLMDQHRWPSRIGGKLSSNPLNKSVDLADKVVVRSPTASVSGIGFSPLRKSPTSDSNLSKPAQKSIIEAAARLLSLDYNGKGGSEAKTFDDRSLRVSGPYKQMPISSSEKPTVESPTIRSQSLRIPLMRPASPSRSSLLSQMPISSSEKSPEESPPIRSKSLHIPFMRPASPSRASLLSSSRGFSPSRTRPATPSSPSRASSPSRIRPATPSSQSTGTNSVLSFIADVKKGKKSSTYIDDAHQLRLLYNRYLQWRFVNARAEAVLYMQKLTAEETLYNVWSNTLILWDSVIRKRINLQQLKLEIKLNSVLNDQIAYIDDWAFLEREHISSLAGLVEDLEASTLRLPLNGGAKADIESLRTAICTAVGVMDATGSSIRSLLQRVEDMNSWVSELAITATQEKLLLDECEDLLSTTADMQIEEYSLRTHLIQSKEVLENN